MTNLLARLWRHFPELAGLVIATWVQVWFCRRLSETAAAKRSAALRWAIRAGAVLTSVWIAFGLIGMIARLGHVLPSSPVLFWIRGGALAWCFASVSAFAVLWLWRRLPVEYRSERRGFIRVAGAAALAAPFGAIAFGIVQRKDFRSLEIDIPIPHLPPDLAGVRIVQLSDLHLSPFLSERELARAVDMANEFRAHLAVVTGDLITTSGDPLDACLRQIARLRADHGTLGCLGNHEIYARVEEEATEKAARLGIPFLRQQARRLRFGKAVLNVTGVDYQHMGGPYLRGAKSALVPGATNVLLSHNPDVFNTAAEQGWDLTLSGHTHGGQVNVEILNQSINPARFFTPYVYGLYRRGPSSLWVTRGIGTVGMPARIGAPPEVVLIRLCAI
ncbi:MAG TPA: metallophosphoesterase [Bryobacteraceae bacterium]|nr:metallophosphoesterase [Bryobacteraceae bacterium]